MKEPVILSGIEPETKARLLDALANKTYKDYFLHIEDASKGLKSKPLSTSAAPFADDGPDDQYEPVTTSVRRDYKPKRQSCVVYAEVCGALHELSSISDVLEAMMDGVDGEPVRSSNCKTRLIQNEQPSNCCSLLAGCTGTSVLAICCGSSETVGLVAYLVI
jgi:hypothetical protein